ncbi:MAG TPA: peptidoglycan-binding domain-containing protein [Acidothermaceae bacterium]|nr:peptidoglycan-binding domain-containing protein [Acidothermaceae bacterium]
MTLPDLDTATVTALQTRLAALYPDAGVVVDGTFGPVSRDALHLFLGTDPGADLTADDVRQLQAHLRLTQLTGVWDDATTQALREALAAGTF